MYIIYMSEYTYCYCACQFEVCIYRCNTKYTWSCVL